MALYLMRMKTVFLFPILLFCSCALFPKNGQQKHMEKQFEPEKTQTVSPHQKELNNAYDNAAIDDYYKEIYKKEMLVPAEDGKMLSITELLFSSAGEYDLFYFVVFTKSLNGADGAYAEAAGNAALRFVNERTALFAEYFSSNLAKLKSNDLDKWAYFIKSEIAIAHEGNETAAINELEKQWKKNVQNSSQEQQAVIELLLKKL